MTRPFYRQDINVKTVLENVTVMQLLSNVSFFICSLSIKPIYLWTFKGFSVHKYFYKPDTDKYLCDDTFQVKIVNSCYQEN